MSPRAVKEKFGIKIKRIGDKENIDGFYRMVQRVYFFYSPFLDAFIDSKDPQVAEYIKSHFIVCFLVPVVDYVRQNSQAARDLCLRLDPEVKMGTSSRMDFMLTINLNGDRNSLVVVEVKAGSPTEALLQCVQAMMEMHETTGRTVKGGFVLIAFNGSWCPTMAATGGHPKTSRCSTTRSSPVRPPWRTES